MFYLTGLIGRIFQTFINLILVGLVVSIAILGYELGVRHLNKVKIKGEIKILRAKIALVEKKSLMRKQYITKLRCLKQGYVNITKGRGYCKGLYLKPLKLKQQLKDRYFSYLLYPTLLLIIIFGLAKWMTWLFFGERKNDSYLIR